MQEVTLPEIIQEVHKQMLKSKTPDLPKKEVTNQKHRKVFRSKTQEELKTHKKVPLNDHYDFTKPKRNANGFKSQRPKSVDINYNHNTHLAYLARKSTGSNFSFFKIRSRSGSSNEPEKVLDSSIRKRLSGHFKDSLEAVFTKISDKHVKYLSEFGWVMY